ncbi:hypothetical protein [Streptomyces tricolor]|uniref:hypothetical protein n=1 Tax=Streptomyces tricolor TaxID=68277 RepID=UPI0036E27AC9
MRDDSAIDGATTTARPAGPDRFAHVLRTGPVAADTGRQDATFRVRHRPGPAGHRLQKAASSQAYT